MKILPVARGHWTKSLRASLPLGPLWKITLRRTPEKANLNRKNASIPYDCTVVATNDYTEAFEQQLTGCDGACRQAPAVIYSDRRCMDLPRHQANGVVSLYKISKQASDRHGKGDDQWVFEYHAPYRKRSIQ